jgi:hypothetical protein
MAEYGKKHHHKHEHDKHEHSAEHSVKEHVKEAVKEVKKTVRADGGKAQKLGFKSPQAYQRFLDKFGS